MFTKLTDTSKAAIFAVLVLCLSVGAALLIRFLELPQGYVMFTIWSFTPTVAALIMLLVVTREGCSKEGWKSLGLHRLGLSVWWIAFGVTLLITVVGAGRRGTVSRGGSGIPMSSRYSSRRSTGGATGSTSTSGLACSVLSSVPDSGIRTSEHTPSGARVNTRLVIRRESPLSPGPIA